MSYTVAQLTDPRDAPTYCRRLLFLSPFFFSLAGVWSTLYGTSCSLQHIVLLCAELQDSMIGNKGTCPPPESWARRKHALLQVRRTTLLYLFTIAGPCRLSVPLASAAARLAAARSDHRVYSCAFLQLTATPIWPGFNDVRSRDEFTLEVPIGITV